MINYNLAATPLTHCVSISGASVMIADSDDGCQERIQGSGGKALGELGVKIITLSAELKAQIASSDASRPSDENRAVVNSVNAPVLIIYTRLY